MAQNKFQIAISETTLWPPTYYLLLLLLQSQGIQTWEEGGSYTWFTILLQPREEISSYWI